MKTETYNPSRLEVEVAEALAELAPQLQEKLSVFKITNVQKDVSIDNPTVTFQLKDQDGDKHELVLRVYQKPDPVI
ncbi:hypothetical protein AB9P05_21060 [Roseivirga sp. BDSF3-8]|uniref:hypothetical protein n=1 Tax=Roseivirga sp. BDSF3-8 TaxID=3241598 RepID=UPI003531ECF2